VGAQLQVIFREGPYPGRRDEGHRFIVLACLKEQGGAERLVVRDCLASGLSKLFLRFSPGAICGARLDTQPAITRAVYENVCVDQESILG